MKIYFHGAMGDVTGSAYHVRTGKECAPVKNRSSRCRRRKMCFV